jgi:acetylornithine deacetylase/succinyl-diaminopimelate desuccinylase-like protein
MTMAVNSRAGLPDLAYGAAETLTRVLSIPQVRASLGWVRTQEAQIAQWQLELSRIPAPPFGEAARSEWLSARFGEVGLEGVAVDEVGNVIGLRPGLGRQCISISAHIDTVFPAGTPLNVRQLGSRLYGPGVSDNGAGVAALLAVAAAMRICQVPHTLPILFVGNVGEEGEGDLRGMRHLFTVSPWKDTILYSLVLDGAGSDTIVSEALGSRRFEVIVRGPGGHSWSDFGAPNPILVLARAMNSFAQTPVPSSPKTVFNVGVVRGGTSVNSIPESASMRVDIRSTSTAEMERLEDSLRLSLDRALEEELQAVEKRGLASRRPSGLSSEVVPIGNRPAGELHSSAHILQAITAVDSYLGNAAQIHRASTDANVPLSLGREAIAIGGGGSGGGAHTLQEWFDCSGRELGLRRILLALLTLSGVA